MKVSTEKIENSQVVLQVEADADEVERAMQSAYSRLVERVEVPGFRRGKAPHDTLERYVGREALLQEALEKLVPRLLGQAIEEQQIDAIAQPEVEVTGVEPVTFKATVPVRPTVELGDYRHIEIPLEPVEVSDEDVDRTIDQLRHQNATWEPVERPVQSGDLVTMDVEGNADGNSLVERKGIPFQVLKEMPIPVPGFAEQMEGLEREQEKEFTITLPPDYEAKELAGKDCKFRVRVSEVKEQRLPEMDDEFAKSLGQGFETLEALREDILANLQRMAEDGARNRHEGKVIEAAVELSTVEYPPVLVEQEVDRYLAAQERELRARQISLEDYLRNQQKSAEELREELRPAAGKQVASVLVLEKVAEAEQLSVSGEEVDGEVETMAQGAGERGDELRKLFQNPSARQSLERVLLTRKTVKLLVDIATGEAKAPETTEASKTAEASETTEASETAETVEASETAEAAEPSAGEDEGRSGGDESA